MTDENKKLISALGEISKLLNSSNNHVDILNKALNILGVSLGARDIHLIKKRFVDKDNFILECLGCWHASKKDVTANACEFELLQPRDIPQEWWKRLEAHEQVFINELSSSTLGSFSDLMFIPLFLEEHLFGFLSFSDLKDKDITTSRQDFLETVGHIFELFIANLNMEKRLNDIIDFMPEPTFVMNSNGVITSWNRSVEELTGWKAKRVLGKGNYEHAIPFYNQRRPTVSNLILHPDPEWEAKYHKFKREGDEVFVLAHCSGLPGGGAFLTGKTSRLYNVDGRLWGAIHSVRDVTRERQIEKNLHQSEAMYRTITDFAGVGMMLFQKDRILYYNERLAEMIGVSEREITMGDLTNWVHPEDREEVFGHFENLFQRPHEPSRFELRAQNGEILRHYSGYAQVMEFEDQPTIHFILDDITEQKELAQKARLNELRMYHEDRLTSLGIMAAGIAHELNQPLNTIRVITDGLLFGRDEGWDLDHNELFENQEMISRQVVRMSQVIQNIRDFSREDRDKSATDISLNEAVENVFSMIGHQLKVHGIQVQKDLSTGLSLIKANLNRLEQVIMNLVVNARQALDECSHDRKELWVRTGANNGQIFIEVGDNATGVPAGLMSKLFDPFFTTKEVGKGTGLGLTISQSIVAEFKGIIEVFNNEKGGATFVVSAPANGG